MELSLELTDEIFDSELAKPRSEMFSNRTFWIEKEVCMNLNVECDHIYCKRIIAYARGKIL